MLRIFWEADFRALFEFSERPIVVLDGFTYQGYMWQGFEEAARENIARLAGRGDLPFLPEWIGSWWDREAVIDLLAVSDSEASIMRRECKWSSRPVGVNIWRDLNEKSLLILEGRGRVSRAPLSVRLHSGTNSGVPTGRVQNRLSNGLYALSRDQDD